MKKLFDLKIYFEGLRNLRIFGLITTVVMSLYSVITTVAMVLESAVYKSTGENVVEYIGLSRVNPLLVLLFCVVAPLMTVLVFSFTSNRAASDYYFAIPKSRGCLFFSFFSSVMTWVIFAAVVSSAAPIIISLFCSKYIVVNYLASLVFFLECLVAAFFVAAAVTLAVSVTGTTISTIMVALMIIFLPRIFLMVVSNVALSNLPIVGETISAIPMLSYKTQIPFGFVVSTFIEGFYTKPPVSAFIYTLVVGIIYLVLGYFLFKKRESEAASKAAATPMLRAIFRVCLSGGVGLVVPAVIFITLYQEDDWLYMGILTAAFSILSFVVYCCYELISTKSAKSMVKAMPGFIAVVLVELATFGIMHGVRSSTVNYSPKPQEIEGIYLKSNAYKDYWAALSEDVLIENTEAKVIISEALEENLKYCTTGDPHDYYSKYYNDKGSSYTQWSVTIVSGGMKHNRFISVDGTNSQRLVEILEDIPEYKNIYTNFPDANDKSTKVNIWEFDLDDQKIMSIYNAYLKDLNKGNIGFEEIYNHVNGIDTMSCYFEFNVSTIVGLENYDFYLPVTYNCTETLNKLYQFFEKNNASNAKLALELAEEYTDFTNSKEIYTEAELWSDGGAVHFEMNSERLEMLKNSQVEGFKAGDNIVKFHISHYDEETPTNYSYTAYFKISQKDTQKIMENHY